MEKNPSLLDNQGFDLWANNYDRDVNLSDETNTYPCAGYRQVLGEIYADILQTGAKKVLDLGFGTGVLTKKLYDAGIEIYGQDFSGRMLKLAQEKMPAAKLHQGDLQNGLVDDLKCEKYDAIVATYSLHHLNDSKKVEFVKELQHLLSPGGVISIGDVAFVTRERLEQCRTRVGRGWDTAEIYFVSDEFCPNFVDCTFNQKSMCAGIFKIKR